MNSSSRAVFLFVLVFGSCVTLGCSEETTGPAEHPSIWPESHLWSKRFGDDSSQYLDAAAADASGSVVLAGHFYGTVDFGGGALATAGSYDIFVARLWSDGAHRWSRRFGDGHEQCVTGLALDASGNVIVAGYFFGAIDFGGGVLTNAGDTDVFVAKFWPGGTHLWSKRFGGAGTESVTAVAVDGSGNVIIAGYASGLVDFGAGVLVSGLFVAKFAPDGSYLWSKGFGHGGYASAVAADGSGNVFVTGSFSGTVDLGGGSLASAGDTDIFVAKFDPDGAHLWSKRFGDGNAQQVTAGAVDAPGNVIVTGYFDGTVDFGGRALTSAGGGDIFTAKFDPEGAHLWSKRFGDDNNQYVDAVAVDALGNVIITGSFLGVVDFGDGALKCAGIYPDIFVAEFAPDGALLSCERFGDKYRQLGNAVAVDASGKVNLAGTFEKTVDFGGGALTSAGEYDVFVAKFFP